LGKYQFNEHHRISAKDIGERSKTGSNTKFGIWVTNSFFWQNSSLPVEQSRAEQKGNFIQTAFNSRTFQTLRDNMKHISLHGGSLSVMLNEKAIDMGDPSTATN
jgi:hypothetical protein